MRLIRNLHRWHHVKCSELLLTFKSPCVTRLWACRSAFQGVKLQHVARVRAKHPSQILPPRLQQANKPGVIQLYPLLLFCWLLLLPRPVYHVDALVGMSRCLLLEELLKVYCGKHTPRGGHWLVRQSAKYTYRRCKGLQCV